MKHLIGTLVVALMAVSYHASAATVTANFDFGEIAKNNEYGASSITFTDNTISVTATGTTAPNDGSGDVWGSYAYLDHDNNGNAGLGVCQNLSGTQCSPNSDDNVTYGETLILDFGEVVTIDALTFSNGNHGTTFHEDATVTITGGLNNGTFALTNIFDVSQINSGSLFEFYNPNSLGGSTVSNDYQFYINDLTVTAQNRTPEVPIPAAVWLFGSGLLGLIGFARRET